MRVFDESKINELTGYDLSHGYLKEDKILIKCHEEVRETGHYSVVRHPNGGASKEWVVDVPHKDAYDEYEEIKVYIPYTQSQKDEIRIQEIRKRLSQLSEDLIQSVAGAYIPDIEDRKKEFATLHNEIRLLLGNSARIYL